MSASRANWRLIGALRLAPISALRLALVLGLVGSGIAAEVPAEAPADPVGVITAAEAGLGPSLWVGASLPQVLRLLALVPVASPSPAQRRLTIRLLLSGGEPLSGGDPGLAFAPLRVAKLAALENAADVVGDPLRLAAIAGSDPTDPDLRAAAAERAAAAGTISDTELAAIYASVRFSPAVLARPLSSVATLGNEKGARARALIYQAMVGEAQPAVLAEMVHHALALLEPAQAIGPVALVALGQLSRLPIDSSTLWLAPAAVRALFVQGRSDAAAPWLKALPAADAALVLARLWPLRVLDGTPVNAADFSSWLASESTTHNGGGRRERPAYVLALLQAAGEPIGAEAWKQVADRVSATAVVLPSPEIWQALQGATIAHQVGEVVLAALVMLGEGGPQALAPVVLAQVIACLREVGLFEDARALAREAVAGLLD
ncbi:MAG: hypothetical protein WCK65_05260 [Rhodospirillaceae bacterium]